MRVREGGRGREGETDRKRGEGVREGEERDYRGMYILRKNYSIPQWQWHWHAVTQLISPPHI